MAGFESDVLLEDESEGCQPGDRKTFFKFPIVLVGESEVLSYSKGTGRQRHML